jgi:hypothetical protein
VTGTATSSIAVDKKQIYFGTKEGYLVCLDARGRRAWAVETDGAITAQPAIGDGVVYVTTSKGTIFGFGTEKGDLFWRYQTPPYNAGEGKWANHSFNAPVSLSDKSAFVVTDRGVVFRFQREIPDRGAPVIGSQRPGEGTEIPGRPPVSFVAYLRDEGSGVDPESVEMYLDGQKVEAEFEPLSGKVSYVTPVTQPVVPLTDGSHNVRVVALDWWKNKAEVKWDLKVNNRLAGGR